MRRAVLLAAMAAACAPAGANAAPRPDLQIGSFAVPPTGQTPLSQIALRVVTRNAGSRRSSASHSALFLSRDARRSGDDVRLLRIRVPALRVRRSTRRTGHVPLPRTVVAGSYRIIACADDRRAVRERSERNNCRAGKGILRIIVLGVPLPAAASPNVAPPPPPPAVSDDTDGDGTRNLDDCAPGDATVHPDALDRPDLPAMRDTNCDGVDGDAARSVFVAPDGADADPGTRGEPKRTLAAAMSAATPQAPHVLVREGDYPEALSVADGIGVYGGYAADWSRSISRTARLTSPTRYGATARTVRRPTSLQLLTIRAADAADGLSSYGLFASESPGLRLERIVAIAGRGSDGRRGDTGRSGDAGVNGADGVPGGCDTDMEFDADGNTRVGPGVGGAGGPSSGAGRNGGRGGDGDYGRGIYGSAGARGGGAQGGAGGQLGHNDDPGTAGTKGLDGGLGFAGEAGSGGAGGFFDASTGDWTGRAGSNGTAGTSGHGGGGGGGGGGNYCFLCDSGTGNGGGGGGGGGQGGLGGQGGRPGGGSFGIAFYGASGAMIIDSEGVAADGGSGGHGGDGGRGAAGGGRGIGAGACLSEIGRGGNGGIGGHGGNGGHGGGGAGGPTIGLLARSSELVVERSTFRFGAGGAGGSGSGFSGAPGFALERSV